MSESRIVESLSQGIVRRVCILSVVACGTLRFENGRITAIEERSGDAEWVALPPLADLHHHANRAFTPRHGQIRSLKDAVKQAGRLFEKFGENEYAQHAARLYRLARSRGTSSLRTHADVDPGTGLAAVAGSLKAREAFGEDMEIQVVAFASARCDMAGPEGQAMIRDAVAMGAELLGAVPVLTPQPGRTIDATLDLALKLGVPVDLHLDEHLDPGNSWSEYLADACLDRECGRRVTASHVCVVSALAPEQRRRVIDKFARAGITVIALPHTNLFIQGRGTGSPELRGLTCASEFLEAGVPVRLGSDNVQDVFYPYGDADPLTNAILGRLAGHIDDPTDLIAAICAGRGPLKRGDASDFILIRGGSFDEILALRPHRRLRVQGGRPLSLDPL